MTDKYDVVIIGGGPGGYTAGIRAAQLGKKTAVVESRHLGGICLNWGCIPTKALLHSARVYENIRDADKYGLVATATVDWPAVVKRSRDVAERLAKGVEFLFKKYGVSHHSGQGRLVGNTSVELTPPTGTSYLLQAEHIIVATGARSRVLPGLEPDGQRVITSKEAMVLPSIPERMAIIGAGAIGVEFAYLYRVFGAEITLIEMLPQLLPGQDEEVARELTRSFKKRKISMFTGTAVECIDRQKDQVVAHTSGKHIEDITADVILVAAGVQGNVEGLGLEELGIAVEKGRVKVDKFYHTGSAKIYAIGDVVGAPLLAHAASAEGICAVEHLADLKPKPLNHDSTPSCSYCHPQVAAVGLTENAAREAGYEIRTGKFPFRASGKSQATGDIDGFVKVIYSTGDGKLLGAHIIGEHATDLISELAVAHRAGLTSTDLLKTIHPHPTLSEAIMEATALAWDESVNY